MLVLYNSEGSSAMRPNNTEKVLVTRDSAVAFDIIFLNRSCMFIHSSHRVINTNATLKAINANRVPVCDAAEGLGSPAPGKLQAPGSLWL